MDHVIGGMHDALLVDAVFRVLSLARSICTAGDRRPGICPFLEFFLFWSYESRTIRNYDEKKEIELMARKLNCSIGFVDQLGRILSPNIVRNGKNARLAEQQTATASVCTGASMCRESESSHTKSAAAVKDVLKSAHHTR
jgi:hypothetical protein